MRIVNIHEAKTNLSRLIELVLQGEEIVIARAGKPLVTLQHYEATHVDKRQRKPGYWKGKIKMSDDFNELPENFMKSFHGDDE